MDLSCEKPYAGANVGIDGTSLWMQTDVVQGYTANVCLKCPGTEDKNMTVTQYPQDAEETSSS